MRFLRAPARAVLLGGALLVVARAGVADTPEQQVALTVGKATLTVGDIQDRLNGVPAFQLATFGSTPAQVRKAFVTRVLVPELLYSQEAERQHLEQNPKVHDRMLGVLSDAMQHALTADVLHQTPIRDADVKAYYNAHKADYKSPERIRIWRILVSDKAAAAKIIGEVHGPSGPERWAGLARSRSLDKATGMRNGDLGFVRPNGDTDKPRVRVDPALFAAADKVKDGEIVQHPVQEGSKWAVVWRRGSLAPTHRSLADEDRAIRQIILRKTVKQAMRDLLASLRTEHVSDEHAALLDYLRIDASGDVTARNRPGMLPRGRASAAPAPLPTPRGLR